MRIIPSSNYGSYINRSVCILEFKDLPYEMINEVVNKLHPKHTFSTCFVIKHSGTKFEWFIPLRKDNPTLLIAYSIGYYQKFHDKVKGINGFEVLDMEFFNK